MIRRKRQYKAFWKFFYCGDLVVEDYILIMQDPVEGFEKILKEFNEKVPEVNNEKLNDLFFRLCRPNTREKKKKKQKTKKKEDKEADPLKDFHILEAMVMKALWQQLSEIRGRTLEYFFLLLDDMDVILWSKSLKDKREASKPDKKKMKNILWDFYKVKK